MARKLQITWAPGEQVAGYLARPVEPARRVAVLLAHGAGVGQLHPFMVTMRDGLARHGVPTMTFDYRYTNAGRSSPDRMETLIAVHKAAAERLAGRYGRVVLVGKSMGGRVGSHLVGDDGYDAAGLAYLGYPLVPPGKAEPRPTAHLEAIGVPQLFITGTRDRLSPPELMRPLAARLDRAAIHVVDDADHSLRVPKRVGLAAHEVLAGVVAVVSAWLARCEA